MPRDLPAQVLTQMDATNKRPVLLFEVGLSSPLRFAAYKTNITFPTAGNVYTAKSIKLSGISQALEGQIGRVTCQFDNVLTDMAAYAAIEDFRGKSLVIKRIYLDAVSDASHYNEIFNGYMERPSEIGREWLVVSATSGKPLSRKSLEFTYQRMCPWMFGRTRCNTDGLADLSTLSASGTAESGTTGSLVDSALTQGDDFWKYGQIKLTKSNINYLRKVKGSVSSTGTIVFDVELPVAVDATTTYTVYKGCDQTLDSCEAGNAWGPSADNHLNFGGCIHITSKQDAES